MNIEKMHCTAFKRYGEKRDGVFNSIQAHSIGTAQNTAKAIRDNMNQYSPGGIVHAVVDAEKEDHAIELLPDDNIAWADGGYGNHHSYTFEIAESDYMKYTGGASYKILDNDKFLADITRGYKNAVKFAALKCKEFGFDPRAKLPNGLHVLYSHDEGRAAGVSSAHVDPSHIWPKIGKTMDDFRADVAEAMELTGEVAEDPATDKLWMGWTKRESGSVGFRQTNGDSGKAYGKYQFDYRYALVPFLQFCVDYNSGHYGAFDVYAGYGAGSYKLVNNSGLAAAWIKACDTYPEEFEALQDTYAYQYYYLEAKRYIKNLYGINMDNHSPAVKGSLFSMAIRSGTLTGARKFAGCNDSTADKTMINTAYATYGNEDAGRWTKAGQWGDALAALESGEYTEIAVGEPSAQEPVEVTETEWYRVRESWANAASQTGAFHDLALAKAEADRTGLNVYDGSGKKIYPDDSSVIDKACSWAVEIADDNSHGYNNGSWGPEYSCISLVMSAYTQAGVNVGKCNIDKMPDKLIKAGFTDVTSEVDFKTGAGLKKGDVLWLIREDKHGHTELYLGDRQMVGAREDQDGKAGDSSGNEISVIAYQNMGWQKALRFATKEEETKEYIVQVGMFEKKSNAQKKANQLKAKGFDCIVKADLSQWRAQAGVFKLEANAKKLVKQLKNAGFDAIVK